MNIYRNYLKRTIDFLLSAAGLIVLFPVWALIALLIRCKIGKPILFRQERVGKDEKIFIMYKFRTMTDKRGKDGRLLPDEERMTKFGAFLRGTSLDELPELLNILKGDLSIIGPRPLLVDYLPYYTEEERLRHSVRGGLTVPEVLHNNIMPSWEEQFAYEVDYAKHVSFVLDVRILVYTMLGVLKRKHEGYGRYIRKPLNEERGGIHK